MKLRATEQRKHLNNINAVNNLGKRRIDLPFKMKQTIV